MPRLISPIASSLTLPRSSEIFSAILSIFSSSKILYSNKTETLLAIEKDFHSLKASIELLIVFSIV